MAVRRGDRRIRSSVQQLAVFPAVRRVMPIPPFGQPRSRLNRDFTRRAILLTTHRLKKSDALGREEHRDRTARIGATRTLDHQKWR